ncbi:50S ribosomal protein L22 [Candidatus Saccharibacteria bacterium]|nr:50S ribosomal protein L22 [Candidatus Saccharibacteria bacterium]NIV03852.1 50S ribosomal protein L22 [Calditrichia bacterium]NIS38411.1 50S ribosomal protein L22 [Candidatus Saccharibacteria bacterium]NIV72187.1 50S ribosomal protein L22 [Calditrichia bacterium]NIV99100.1 50S ribosomal protein L22 [Candidatus Saccharibacteria bacterium]
MEVKATARYLRVSPKKVRLVIDVVRGMDVEKALIQLTHLRKDAKQYVIKLLNSAIANAEHNHELKRENLYIKKITADGGPILHRWRPRAHGRAGAIRKRTTHLTIVLDERVPTEEKKEKKTKKEKPLKKTEKKVVKKTPAKKEEKPAKEVKKSAKGGSASEGEDKPKTVKKK